MMRQKRTYGKPRNAGPAKVAETAGEAKDAESKPEIKFAFKTELGKKIASGEITSLQEIYERNLVIREAAIVDALVPNMFNDFVLVGQARGKFGGGKRRLIKQTQKKTAEGNKPHFSAIAIVGNQNGFVGLGKGVAVESMPARDKALRNAKLNVISVLRGCGSWKCNCGEPHSIPFQVEASVGSVKVKLMPAPKGTGLVCENEIKKLMKAAGIKDVWAKSNGQTRHKENFLNATFKALQKCAAMRTKDYKVYRGAV